MKIQVENLSDATDPVVQISSNLPNFVELATALVGASLILFVLIVLPLWIFLHYRLKARREAPAPVIGPDAADLAQIARIAERMEGRLAAMETLMDADRPGWRR